MDSTGNIISSLTGLHVAAIAYFQSLLMLVAHTLDDDLIHLIPKLVLDEDNMMLMRPFTIEEAMKATFVIPLDSVGSVGGFPSAFTHSQEVIGQSIVDGANEFLRSKLLSCYLTHACLVMIPKAKTLVSLGNF